MIQVKEDRSLGELFSELSQETTKMLHQEVELAKTEMSMKVFQVIKDIAFLIIGGVVLYIGLFPLIGAAVIGLWAAAPEYISLWMSCLIIGFIFIGIGLFLLLKGIKNLKREDLKPQKTIETIKEGKEWVKKQI